ncbi:MAG: DNA (cytosine-5-)-methyltransferase [Bacteroidota bacterium]
MSIKVVELFAGVGGFRLGLEGYRGKSATSNYLKNLNSKFQIIFSNQWEPSTKTQHASLVYENKWDSGIHTNVDISQISTEQIPDHDLLVGGFPCQDYSVATSLKNSKGLQGKKGVLWWEIHRIIQEKQNKPSYLFLENVDRLLISPSKSRGRDFAIMLKCLNNEGYAVEWRVINSADYGFPQRRKRTFIVAYKVGTNLNKDCRESNIQDWLFRNSIIATAFPVHYQDNYSEFCLSQSVQEISDSYNGGDFLNAGYMLNGVVYTQKVTPDYNEKFVTLGDILQSEPIPAEYYISEVELDKWKYLKGAKRESRTNSSGFTFFYTEGAMSFPDSLDKPSRTIITGEGGKSPSRFKHVIYQNGKYRRLTPLELERLNMFPDNHTKLDGISSTKQAFFMGNALVVGVIEKIGKELAKRH